MLLDERGLGADEFGRDFFVPTAREAWSEICRAGAVETPWSHPLLGDAIELTSTVEWNGQILLDYAEFASVFERLRRARIEDCTAGYERIA